jgi:hypothetical protein
MDKDDFILKKVRKGAGKTLAKARYPCACA